MALTLTDRLAIVAGRAADQAAVLRHVEQMEDLARACRAQFVRLCRDDLVSRIDAELAS